MAEQLLLFSNQPEILTFCAAAADAAGLALNHCQSIDQLAKQIAANRGKIDTFIDISTVNVLLNFQDSMKAVGLTNRVDPNYFHFFTPNAIGNIPELTSSGLVGHVLLTKFGDAYEQGREYGNILVANKAETPLTLEPFLARGSRIHSFLIQSLEGKSQTLNVLNRISRSAGFTTRIAARISSAVDEILLNAFMHGQNLDLMPSHEHADRNGYRSRGVTLKVGLDEQKIVALISDSAGTLKKGTLLKHLEAQFTDLETGLASPQGGAGIGLASTYSTGCSLLFSCRLNCTTQVVIIFRRTSDVRQFKKQFRFLSTLFYK